MTIGVCWLVRFVFFVNIYIYMDLPENVVVFVVSVGLVSFDGTYGLICWLVCFWLLIHKLYNSVPCFIFQA